MLPVCCTTSAGYLQALVWINSLYVQSHVNTSNLLQFIFIIFRILFCSAGDLVCFKGN